MAMSGEERTRKYRARQAARLAADEPLAFAPPLPGPGEVEAAVRAELALLGQVLQTMPGVCATAVTLARMLDRNTERTAAVAAQLRMTLQDLRQSAQSASGSGRLAGLRSATARQRSA